jgi:hypothetical protein
MNISDLIDSKAHLLYSVRLVLTCGVILDATGIPSVKNLDTKNDKKRSVIAVSNFSEFFKIFLT